MNAPAKKKSTTRLLLWVLPVLLLAGATYLLLGPGGDDRDPVDVVPTAHDFGRIRFGVEKEVRFRIRNNSDQAVTIRSAKANCACFAVKRPPSMRLSVGEETDIVLQMRSSMTAPTKFRGKRIRIETDHPDVPVILLPLEGEIFAPFWVEPKSLDVGMVGDEASDYEPRRIAVHQERGFKVELNADLQGYDGGYSLQHPKMFEVTTEPIEDGIAFLVRLREEGRPHVNQIRSALTMALRVSGKDMPEEPVFKRIDIRGNWVPKPVKKKSTDE